MTQVGTTPTPYGSASSPPAGAGFVEWSPVFAGAVLAGAISFVLLAFGTAIGLSATSPWPNSGLSVKVIASLAVFWIMIQQIGSLMIGGYLAGRMRSRWHETSRHEVEFRDGLHGGLVWAIGVVISAGLVLATAGAAARTAAQIAASAAPSASASMDLVLDTMLRPTVAAQASAPSSPGATSSRPRAAAVATTDEQRAEMARILTSSVASRSITDQNRTYLAQLVAQRAGVSQEEAEKRVDTAFTSAREAADKARRAAVLTGLVTAASLFVSLGAAWWAAMKGGQHRDNSIPASFGFAPRARPRAPVA